MRPFSYFCRLVYKTAAWGLHTFQRVYRDLSLRSKLIIIAVVISIPFFCIIYLNYSSSERLLRENATQYSYDVLKMIELRFDDHIQSLSEILQDAVYDQQIYVPMQKACFSETDVENVRKYLNNLIKGQPEVQSVCLCSNGGDYVYVDNSSAGQSILSILPPGSSQLNTVRRAASISGGLPSWYIDQEESGSNIIYTCSVYNESRNKVIGFMAIVINSNYFSAPFQNVQNQSMKNIVVLSSKNIVILRRSGTDMNLLSQSDIDRMGTDGWMVNKSNQVLYTYTQMVNPEWKMVSFVRLSELYSGIRSLRRNFLLLCLAFLAVILLISYMIFFDLSSALRTLMSGMKKMQYGARNVHIDLERRDEIGYVGQAFNAMSHEISVLEDWGYHEQLTRKEAEIRSLQAQINPHFLFNTLESVNWMAQMENVPRISAIVTSLATLLEGNMARDNSVIPISQELKYIDSYMTIMKYRFEDHISLIKRIDPSLEDVEIPRLLIQPVVENAMQHGLEEVARQGRILLKIEAAGNEIHITVEDNGIGIPPEELEQLNQRLQGTDDAYFHRIESSHVGGIGLENVSRRIQLFYGESFGVQVESEKDCFTRVRLRIPYPNQ